MARQLAQIELAPPGGFRGLGKLGSPGSEDVNILANIISSVIGIMTISAIIWFTLKFLSGAISIISAGGDKEALAASRKKIYNAILGLVVTFAAIFVVRLMGLLLGIPNILNLGALFELVTK